MPAWFVHACLVSLSSIIVRRHAHAVARPVTLLLIVAIGFAMPVGLVGLARLVGDRLLH